MSGVAAAIMKQASLGEINELIGVPEKIFTNDGRELLIREWTPTVEFRGPLVEVTIRALVVKRMEAQPL